ncbi:MAG: response regulator [Enterobacteriaceae bacterium]
MFQVMLVEDDRRLSALIEEYLCSYEFQVHIVARGDIALSRFQQIQPDIVVLDLMLPGLDGMVVCRQIRAISETPILILTAREDAFDEVSGLEQGADDYVNKPIQPRVLLARLRALLRRSHKAEPATPDDTLQFGSLSISLQRRLVSWQQHTVELSGSEFRLLLALAQSADTVLNRDQLLKKMRGIEFDGQDRSIDNNISRLRRKFEDDDGEKIRTVWGEGYLFDSRKWS